MKIRGISIQKSLRKSLFCLILVSPIILLAQEGEDIYEANRLKKVFPDDRVAATLLEEDYSFGQGRSEDAHQTGAPKIFNPTPSRMARMTNQRRISCAFKLASCEAPAPT